LKGWHKIQGDEIKRKEKKKLTWSLINAPLCSCMYIQGEERKKQQGKDKKKLIGVQ
jgi:hypothetical protein